MTCLVCGLTAARTRGEPSFRPKGATLLCYDPLGEPLDAQETARLLMLKAIALSETTPKLRPVTRPIALR